LPARNAHIPLLGGVVPCTLPQVDHCCSRRRTSVGVVLFNAGKVNGAGHEEQALATW
jgi:hypothetical protein